MPEERRELVHQQSAGYPGAADLGVERGAGGVDRVECRPGGVGDREHERDRERGARREPGTGGDRGRHHRVDAGSHDAAAAERSHRAGDEASPRRFGGAGIGAAVGGDVDEPLELARPDPHPPRGHSPVRDDAVAIDGEWQHEPVVVVGVVAHEVDVSGCAEQPRVSTVSPPSAAVSRSSRPVNREPARRPVA